jgi:hypothetical protein
VVEGALVPLVRFVERSGVGVAHRAMMWVTGPRGQRTFAL